MQKTLLRYNVRSQIHTHLMKYKYSKLFYIYSDKFRNRKTFFRIIRTLYDAKNAFLGRTMILKVDMLMNHQ